MKKIERKIKLGPYKMKEIDRNKIGAEQNLRI